MHTKHYTAPRSAVRSRRVALSPRPTQEPVPFRITERRPQPVQSGLQHRAIMLVRNPLFLVVVTWLVMAGLLVTEILSAQ